ncbi:MAG: hypothetical protein K8M05_21285 [Deltaproteobacteria bacterium]|nr:hypothetical protein [Kofleriaceae bacterium]
MAAKTGTMPKKAVITNGDWIIIFSDPQDSFAVDGDIAIGKILVFEDEAAIDREYPTLFEQLEYSRLSNVREPISACEVGYCVRPGNVAKVMRGIQLLYVENPGIYDPPSPFIKVVPLLFLGSSTGEWLCVKGPDDIEMPSRTEHIPGHILEVEQVSAKLIADCEAVLGELPSPITLADHFAAGLDVLPGVREVRRNMYLVLTGEQPHYFREQPSVSNCRFHDWKQAQGDGVASSPAVWGRSVDPRTFFYSGESQHCAHANVTDLKRSAISAENRSECGPRSGRNGEAFCEIWSFDTRLCCRTCAFETACTSSRIFALPCAPSLTTVGQPSGAMHGPAAEPASELVPLRSRTDLPRQG